MHRIRTAKKEDVQTLAALSLLLASHHAKSGKSDFREDIDASSVCDLFSHIVGKEDHALLVCLLGGHIIGYAWAEVQRRPDTLLMNRRDRVFVHQLYVDENSRGKGIGSSLMREIGVFAISNGVHRVLLDAWTVNSSGQQFFEHSGLVGISKTYERELQEAP